VIVIGQTLSHFRITAKLGEGGMGEVYLAEDTKLQRQVALRILPAAMTGEPSAKESFLQEAIRNYQRVVDLRQDCQPPLCTWVEEANASLFRLSQTDG
jgi:serine/threonine protein kinase